MDQINESDISGIDFQVTNQEDKQANYALSEDEFYPAKLSSITKKKNSNPSWPDQLSWVFSLIDSKFTYNWEGKQIQKVVYGSTSLVFSLKSKAYLWYCKMVNKELAEGEKVKISSLVGKECFVMVKKHVSKAGKTSYIVEKVKYKEQVAPTLASVSTPVTPSVEPVSVTIKEPTQTKTESVVIPPKSEAAFEDIW